MLKTREEKTDGGNANYHSSQENFLSKDTDLAPEIQSPNINDLVTYSGCIVIGSDKPLTTNAQKVHHQSVTVFLARSLVHYITWSETITYTHPV